MYSCRTNNVVWGGALVRLNVLGIIGSLKICFLSDDVDGLGASNNFCFVCLLLKLCPPPFGRQDHYCGLLAHYNESLC